MGRPCPLIPRPCPKPGKRTFGPAALSHWPALFNTFPGLSPSVSLGSGWRSDPWRSRNPSISAGRSPCGTSGRSPSKDWIRSRPEGGIAVPCSSSCSSPASWLRCFGRIPSAISEANIAVTLKAIAPLGVMALRVGVLMIAVRDTSVGALYSFLAIICATMSNAWGGDISGDTVNIWAPFLAFAIVLVLGALIGSFHAFLTLRFAIPLLHRDARRHVEERHAVLPRRRGASSRPSPLRPCSTARSASSTPPSSGLRSSDARCLPVGYRQVNSLHIERNLRPSVSSMIQ